ncbi:MAG: RDD family protein [Candidatus Thorarchaeota archaeon]
MSEKKQTVKADLATFNERLIAGIIDWLIVAAIILVCEIIPSIFNWIATGILAKAAANPFDPNYANWINTAAALAIVATILYVILNLIMVLVNLVYFVWIPTRKNGQTFGKKMRKIQVALIEDEAKGKVRPLEKGDLMPALLRWLLFVVDGIAFGLVGWYFINESPDNQRLGDRIAKTVVINYQEKPAAKATTKTTTTKTPAKTTTTKTDKK